ncbi:MAG: thiamine phosphate synthase [Nitrospinae bacterium]|nr:thiamine phosphate synthase [Nitrospinota bacterium]MBF0633530.1 thiamine phosphate synthase [Nitrospinota bacterium]
MTSHERFSEVDIYPVTGRSLWGEMRDEEVIAELARGGAKIVQLREKNLTTRDYYDLAVLYRIETRRHGMALIVNDRLDIALAAEADGVHLGADDLPVRAARELLGPGAIIGGSSHSAEEALIAQDEGATYVNLGPLFPTPTKPGAKPIGLNEVKKAVSLISIPFTVMGGVTLENLDSVLGAGARKIGVVSAIFGSGDIESATREFKRRIRAVG